MNSARMVGIAALFLGCNSFAAEPRFRHVDVDTDIEIGYGLAIADVDGDKKPDIVLADKKQIVWYQNPDWKKHVIAENLTTLDNVCVAAQDIDGDGKAEIAVGAGWNPGDTVNSGAVFYLVAPDDRTQTWKSIPLHHEPTVHRMRWVQTGGREHKLLVSPLHGRGNRAGLGAPVKQLAYAPASNPSDAWKLETVDATMHATHNFDPTQWDNDLAQEILLAGREAILLLNRTAEGQWNRQPIATNGTHGFAGAGEVRAGKFESGRRFVASIEPMHGTNVCVYTPAAASGGAWDRKTLANNLAEGHALACADLLGTGSDQIVVGWRNKDAQGKVGIRLFQAQDASAGAWTAHSIDDNKMACEDLAVADMNGDGRLDIIAAGRATKNVKLYLNESPE